MDQSEQKLETGQQQIDTNSHLTKTETTEISVAVQTRAMVAKESKPPKPLQISTVQGSDIGPEELKAEQRADETLKKYWELADQPDEDGKIYFFVKKGTVGN